MSSSEIPKPSKSIFLVAVLVIILAFVLVPLEDTIDVRSYVGEGGTIMYKEANYAYDSKTDELVDVNFEYVKAEVKIDGDQYIYTSQKKDIKTRVEYKIFEDRICLVGIFSEFGDRRNEFVSKDEHIVFSKEMLEKKKGMIKQKVKKQQVTKNLSDVVLSEDEKISTVTTHYEVVAEYMGHKNVLKLETKFDQEEKDENSLDTQEVAYWGPEIGFLQLKVSAKKGMLFEITRQ